MLRLASDASHTANANVRIGPIRSLIAKVRLRTEVSIGVGGSCSPLSSTQAAGNSETPENVILSEKLPPFFFSSSHTGFHFTSTRRTHSMGRTAYRAAAAGLVVLVWTIGRQFEFHQVALSNDGDKATTSDAVCNWCKRQCCCAAL